MDFAFLEECFKAGLLEYWSAVSVHPYHRSDPEMVGREYCRLREMIKAYAPPRTGEPGGLVKTQGVREGSVERKDIPIFSSEWGYSAVWPGMSEEKQGQMLARQWLTNVGNNISLSIWYDWQDDGVDPKDPEHHFGMISNDYHEGRDPVFDPKPAHLAAKTLTTFFAGYQFEKRLMLVARTIMCSCFITEKNYVSPRGPPRAPTNCQFHLGQAATGALIIPAPTPGSSLPITMAW